jgi:pyruvate kinase
VLVALVLTVTKVNARANNTAVLGERENMNLPGCKVLQPTLTEKDEDDLVNFGLVHGIDYISASFGLTIQDLDDTRKVLGPRHHLEDRVARGHGELPRDSGQHGRHHGCP